MSEQLQFDFHGCGESSSVLVFPSAMLVVITAGPEKNK